MLKFINKFQKISLEKYRAKNDLFKSIFSNPSPALFASSRIGRGQAGLCTGANTCKYKEVPVSLQTQEKPAWTDFTTTLRIKEGYLIFINMDLILLKLSGCGSSINILLFLNWAVIESFPFFFQLKKGCDKT